MAFSGATHRLPYIRNYAEALKWWNEHPKPPRSRKWENHQRPLYNTASKHYRLESLNPEQHIDVVLYGTTMARYYVPDADGNQRRLYMGDGSLTSRGFMWHVLHINSWGNIERTTDGREVVAPVYCAAFTADHDKWFSADYLFTPDNKLIVEHSAHTPHFRKVSVAEDKERRAHIRELFKPFLDIAMFRMAQYEAEVNINRSAGSPFGSDPLNYKHRIAVEKMFRALSEGTEPEHEHIENFFGIGQAVFNTLASKRAYNQEGFHIKSWSSSSAPTDSYDRLTNKVSANELRQRMSERIIDLLDKGKRTGREILPQFVAKQDYPRSNLFAATNP